MGLAAPSGQGPYRHRTRLVTLVVAEQASRRSRSKIDAVRTGPGVAKLGPVVKVGFERVEALELLAMTLAHLNDAENRTDISPRIPLLMAIRDKLALGLQEE